MIFPEGFKGSLEIWNATHGSTMREIRGEETRVGGERRRRGDEEKVGREVRLGGERRRLRGRRERGGGRRVMRGRSREGREESQQRGTNPTVNIQYKSNFLSFMTSLIPWYRMMQSFSSVSLYCNDS